MLGALNETVHPEAPNIPLITNDTQVNQYKELLLTNLRRIRDTDTSKLIEERQKYIDFAKRFTWTACVDKWLKLYNQVTKSKS